MYSYWGLQSISFRKHIQLLIDLSTVFTLAYSLKDQGKAIGCRLSELIWRLSKTTQDLNDFCPSSLILQCHLPPHSQHRKAAADSMSLFEEERRWEAKGTQLPLILCLCLVLA